MKPPVLPDETQRLVRLMALSVLDSEPEPLFDAIAHQASQLCGTPIAMVNLLDEGRQWSKALVGWPGAREVPRNLSFCTHTMASDSLLEVADARLEPRFADNPMVTGTPHIRFYAGVPLRMSGGEAVGALCVIDHQPRQLNSVQRQALQGLADIASHALELRGALNHKALAVRSRYERELQQTEARYRAIVEDQAEMISLAQADGTLLYVNPAYARHFGKQPDAMVGESLYDYVEPQDREAVRERLTRVVSTGTTEHSDNRMRAADGSERWVAWTNGVQTDANQQRLLHSVGRDVTERYAAERSLRELATIFDNTTDFVAQTDRHGQVVYMNPSARRAVGLPPDAPVGSRTFSEFYTEATNRLFAQTIVPAVNSGAVWVGETSVKLTGRPEVPVSHMVIAHRDAQGRVERYSSVMRDISAETQARQETRRQTDILLSVTESIPATVVVVGNDGHYRFVNGAFERYCGLPRERIIGRTTAEVLGEAEVERRRPWMKRAMAGETVNFTLEYPAPGGATYLALSCIPLRLASGVVDGFVGVSQDITQQKREEDRLVQLAQRDPLTGLLNRGGFERGLELLLLQHAERPGLAVLYIDLDSFKPINDRYGHPAGDQVLVHFARRLLSSVRPTDMVARLGGDEFAIALGGLHEAAHAEAVAEKVLTAARTPFEVGALQLTVGASIGVAFSREAKPNWRDVLAQADARLLAAKAAGKGRQLGGEAS